jgi:hypothetical protein
VAFPAAHSFIASRRAPAKLDPSNTWPPLRLLFKLAAGLVAGTSWLDPQAEEDDSL